MGPTLPISLSPHICVLASPDVHELFESSGLPPIAQTLQSFVPLPNGTICMCILDMHRVAHRSPVTTRTTSLTSVPHATFALRFSDLEQIENAAREDEERRSARTIDWISARISAKAAEWVKTTEAQGSGGSGGKGIWQDRTPWWEELKRCIEGDCIPNSDEGWNHPTASAYPEQVKHYMPECCYSHPRRVDTSGQPASSIARTQYTSCRTTYMGRAYCVAILPDYPSRQLRAHGPYVRTPIRAHSAVLNRASYSAEALFNAVKKQYGLHSYLLPLALPTNPLPAPVPVPLLLPRLPPPPPPSPAFDTPPLAPAPTPAGLAVPNTPRALMSPIPIPRSPGPSVLAPGQRDGAAQTPASGYAIRLSEGDIQQTGKFVREFVVMSLITWMEKCVMEWNENVCCVNIVHVMNSYHMFAVLFITAPPFSPVLIYETPFRLFGCFDCDCAFDTWAWSKPLGIIGVG